MVISRHVYIIWTLFYSNNHESRFPLTASRIMGLWFKLIFFLSVRFNLKLFESMRFILKSSLNYGQVQRNIKHAQIKLANLGFSEENKK